jgi:hypothetical protein
MKKKKVYPALEDYDGNNLNMFQILSGAVPWLRRLAAGLPPRKPGFDPGPVHVGFVVDKVSLGQVFPRVLRFSAVNFIEIDKK